tara:strand:- start:320 stop:592 length:273 start_codon:yes stop_codon:yes gene_type:complete
MSEIIKLTREYFMKLRDKAIVDYLADIKDAPVKRGWNAFLRQQIPSQRDVTAKCQSYLKSLNDTCVALGHDAIWEEEDETDPGLQGSPAD